MNLLTECGTKITIDKDLCDLVSKYKWHLNDSGNIITWGSIEGKRGVSLRRIAKEGFKNHTSRRIHLRDGDPTNLSSINLTYSNLTIERIEGEMLKATLPSGEIFLASEEDLGLLDNYSWYINKLGYVSTDISSEERYLLHRLITDAHNYPDKVVDHIDRDKLNNTRSNLRLVNHVDNLWNRGAQKNSKSKYKGVSKLPSGRYSVRVKENGFGTYDNEEIAAGVYNHYAKEISEGFAYLNDVPNYSREEAEEIEKKLRIIQ